MRDLVGKKPQYRWCNEQFQELVHDLQSVLSMPPMCTYIAAWNDYTQKWEFGLSTGTRIDRLWNKEALPPTFRLHLLLEGVPA